MKKQTTPYKTEPLAKHEKKTFDCGVESLNNYLKTQAKQDQKRKIASCFVYCCPEKTKVMGYYTLSSSTVSIEDLPEDWQKKLPLYPRIPATLIGRLAVNLEFGKKGIGGLLLFDAMWRAYNACDTVASFAVMVDVLDIDPDPVGFYEKFGFMRVASSPRTLFLPMASIKKIITGLD